MTDVHRRTAAGSDPVTGGRINVRVLGSVALDREGDDIEIGPKLRRLLAALTVRGGDVVSADRLADVVWNGDPPDGAERTLRTYVTRLRRALDIDGDVLRFREPGYVLDTSMVEIDAERFESYADAAHQQMRAADPRAAVASADSALALWRGEAYAGFEDDDWFQPEIVRLEGRRREVMLLRGDALLGAGDAERAVAEAEGLVAAGPLSEPPRMLLMRALYSAGRQAEAMRVLPEFRSLLADEYGLDPSDEIADLELRIARRQRDLGSGVRLRGYELHERIGSGAFAVVHRAVQPGIDREVAVKIIRADLADRPEFIRRFEHEAHVAARLEHPHIVPLYDYWRDPGAAYLVMRLMRGGSVESALRRSGPYSRERALGVVRDLAGALTVAHRSDVVHRDIKPANVLLDDDGNAYLADFGIATAIQADDDIEIESPAYAAPEQLRHEPVTPATDVHSLGITVYEMLTGRLPFADSHDRTELIRRQLESPIPPISATRTDLDPNVDEVLARATAKAPGDRHSTAAAFMADLAVALEPADVSTAVRRWSVRKVEPTNPYVGLRAFDEADADRFHGREAVVADLADRIASRRLVTVVGPSGTGKSSVVRAGLLPSLRKGAVPGSDQWFITTMLPGPDPFEALGEALLRVAVDPPASLREHLAEPGGLHRAVKRVLPAADAQVLIVVDQFEELFTQSEPDDARRFLDELAATLTRPECPIRMVATLRADHFDRPLSHRAIAPLVTAGLVPIVPMSADEVERAIVAPARAVDVDIEPALVAELVAAVTDRPAALPLLQFCLAEVFDRRVSDVMLLSTYRDSGGLTGALAARADRVIFAGDDTVGDELAARRLFGRLVALGDGTQDTRRRARRPELADDEATTWMIDALAKARLLSYGIDPATREPTVEIAHEALLREWPRLRGWIDDDRADLLVLRQISSAAMSWESAGREVGELARGARLETASEFADRRVELLSPVEREWIAASLDARADEEATHAAAVERDRRHRRRLHRSLVATATLAVVALVAAAISLVLRDRADAAEAAALGRALVRDAEANLSTDPELAQLLAIEAATQFHRAGDGVPPAVAQVLRDGITSNRVSGRVPGGFDVAIDQAGATMATIDAGGGVALWDAATLERLQVTPPPPVPNVLEVWFHPDGGLRALTSSGLGTVADPQAVDIVAWDPAAGAWRSVGSQFVATGAGMFYGADVDDAAGAVALADSSPWIIEPDGAVSEVVFDDVGVDVHAMALALRDGNLAAALSTNPASLRVRTLGSDRADLVIEQLPFEPRWMAFDDTGERIAMSNGDAVAVIGLSSGELSWDPVELTRASGLTWLSDGARIAVGGEAQMTILDAATGAVLDQVASHAGGSGRLVMVPGTNTGFSAGIGDGQTLMLDLGVSAVQPFPVIEPAREAVMMAVSDDGTHLLVRHEQDATVLDLAGGVEIMSTRGLAYGSFNEIRDVNQYTFAVYDRDGEYISAPDADGRSVLIRADGSQVWTAPDGWDIRGVSDDGRQVVIHRQSQGSRLVDVRTGEAIELPDLATVNVARFSPDGRFVSLNEPGWAITVLSTVDGGKVATLQSTPELPTGLWHDYSPDGSLMAVGTGEGQVLIYDLDDLVDGADQGDALRTRIAAHDSVIVPVVFSPDGTLIATVGRANEPARIWRVDTGELVGEFGTFDERTGIAFHPTEPWVYVGEGTTITRHTLDLAELIATASANVTRVLTDTECRQYLGHGCTSHDSTP